MKNNSDERENGGKAELICSKRCSQKSKFITSALGCSELQKAKSNTEMKQSSQMLSI